MKGFNLVDKPTAAALHRMKSPDMQPLLAFFKNLADDTDCALRRAGDDKFAQLQGRAQLLQEFMEAVDSAASTMEKLESNM
tara:strand:- start:3840 stop:4082 length:243 start_codon:yes stop_codon:yes gene_type:complete